MESEFHSGQYIAILKRRYIYIIIPFFVVLAISSAFAILLPPVFQSTGTILIESPQISADAFAIPGPSKTMYISPTIQLGRAAGTRVDLRAELGRAAQHSGAWPSSPPTFFANIFRLQTPLRTFWSRRYYEKIEARTQKQTFRAMKIVSCTSINAYMYIHFILVCQIDFLFNTRFGVLFNKWK